MIEAGVLLLAAVLHRPPERVDRIYENAPSRPVLHLAVVEAESEFNFNARNVNRDGSVDEGAYQTNSRWHPRFADVDEQIDYGAHNLEVVLFRYPDVRHALGAYNTGSPHKGAAYARRVLRIYRTLLNWLGIQEEGKSMRSSRPSFSSVHVAVGGEDYVAMVRKIPARPEAHVGADSPRFMDSGARARVTVLRILRGAVDVTDDLLPWTRRDIEAAARKGA